jgi:hypothetical protein
MKLKSSLVLIGICSALFTAAQTENISEMISKNTAQIEQKVIAWRQDFHQNPELGNR